MQLPPCRELRAGHRILITDYSLIAGPDVSRRYTPELYTMELAPQREHLVASPARTRSRLLAVHAYALLLPLSNSFFLVKYVDSIETKRILLRSREEDKGWNPSRN